MNIKARYVTARPSLANPKRWYWQRPGYPLTRLPDDEAARFLEQKRLNDLADGKDKLPPDYGTVSWALDAYRKSERYTSKSYTTRGIYDRWVRTFESMWGKLRVQDITRRVVVDFVNGLSGASTKSHAVSVLSSMFEMARYYGVVTLNPCERLSLSKAPARDQYWLPEDEAAFLAVCEKRQDWRMRRTFKTLLYTAQRPSDALAMPAALFNGTAIKLRQQKTKKLLALPCHAALKADMELWQSDNGLLCGWPGQGKPRYQRFHDQFTQFLKEAGLTHLQARDLRRTAVVRLFEAGATVPEVAAVTGHSVQRAQHIIDTYYTHTLEIAENAIGKWERKMAAKSNAPSKKSNVS